MIEGWRMSDSDIPSERTIHRALTLLKLLPINVSVPEVESNSIGDINFRWQREDSRGRQYMSIILNEGNIRYMVDMSHHSGDMPMPAAPERPRLPDDMKRYLGIFQD